MPQPLANALCLFTPCVSEFRVTLPVNERKWLPWDGSSAFTMSD
jgi:hypothetical protein